MGSAADVRRHTVRVHDGARWHRLTVLDGANLRRVLLRHGLSPYAPLTRRLNCGGRGLCATCGVQFVRRAPELVPAPRHWHDALAERFGYPRLSCQIAVTHDLAVRLLSGKVVWGARYRRRVR
jgi:ferredoxin